MERNVFRYRQTDSTNDAASRLLRSGEIPTEAYVIADIQEKGRGQGDHSWRSEAGKNLLMSWVIKPAFLSVGAQFLLSKIVSLAISDLLDSYSIPARIKWPNDLISNQRKIAGILIENSITGDRLKHSIIGIGLNINQQQFPEFRLVPTSMRLECRRELDISAIELQLMQLLSQRYMELEEGMMHEQIDSAYRDRLFRLNTPAEFSDGKKVFSGLIRGVDARGELLIETTGGIRAYGFHEIRMIH